MLRVCFFYFKHSECLFLKELVIIVVFSSAGLYIIIIMLVMFMLSCHFYSFYAQAKNEGYLLCCLLLHESKRLNVESCAPCSVLDIFWSHDQKIFNTPYGKHGSKFSLFDSCKSEHGVCFSAWHQLLQLLVLPQSHLPVWLPCLLSYNQSIFRWKTSPFCGLLIGSCKQISLLLAFTRLFLFFYDKKNNTERMLG